MNRTATAAVYPWGWVASLDQDMIEHMLQSNNYVDEADLVEEFYVALWNCIRCRFGNQRTLKGGKVKRLLQEMPVLQLCPRKNHHLAPQRRRLQIPL